MTLLIIHIGTRFIIGSKLNIRCDFTNDMLTELKSTSLPLLLGKTARRQHLKLSLKKLR
jgi:hypothetical protein